MIVKKRNKEQDRVYFNGYAAIYNVVDLQGDLILKDAFWDIQNENEYKLLFQHDITKPIGLIERVVSDDFGL